MADFGILFRTVDSVSANTVINNGSYKAWDIVTAYPAEQCKEDPHPNSPHAILIVTDVPDRAAIQDLIAPRSTPDLTKPLDDHGIQPKRLLARSTWRLFPELLPKKSKDKIDSKKISTCSFSEFKDSLFHKELGVSLSDSGKIKEALHG